MLPTLYVPHGGGPLPVLGDPGHAGLTKFLSGVARRVPEKPKAILLVSAHWEEAEPQLTSAARPGLLYDYYGFPPQSYKLAYPAPGSPELAQRAADLLTAAGFKASLNPKRALDHGAFIPLLLIYPEADVPVVQLSLKASLDPEEHLRMGAALAPLRRAGVLLLGSGLSYHNMAGFARPGRPASGGPGAGLAGQAFQRWLLQACAAAPAERARQLAAWAAAPGARDAHPREEHLLPLMVVAGAAAAADGAAAAAGDGGGDAAAAAQEAARGVVLWDGECMGAAVAGIGFGRFAAAQGT